jgi:hypothetical protein
MPPTHQGAEALRWPLHRYQRPLLRDRWFLIAALLYVAFAVTSICQREWFGLLTGLLIVYFMGGLRNLVSAFRSGYHDE